MEGAATQDFYWDEHGRRYARRGERVGDGGSRGGGGRVEDRDGGSGEVGVAMEIVR